MKDLNYQLKTLCKRNRDGGYSTQVTRSRILDQMAHQLNELGYQKMSPTSLKPKHVEALVNLWDKQGISVGTVKNRMAVLRWWAGKVNKPSIMARKNSAYKIAERSLVSKDSKAQTLQPAQLKLIGDPLVKMSLRLQQAFGLRREEAIKFRPSFAAHDRWVVLKASWTKGGRARKIPILSPEQQTLLDEARQLVRSGAMIPPDLRYVDQLRRYERVTAKAGMTKLHGLRHGYAQRRYEQITGWACPAAGGTSVRGEGPQIAALDRLARMKISAELGHARPQIASVYLGR